MLDVGTGSGAIALALKKVATEAEVHATDVSAEALQVAREEWRALGLTVDWHLGHLCQQVPEQSWHIVVANLPYIAENERPECDPELEHEPQQALFAEDDGMALMSELINEAPKLLAPTGALWLEYGYRQAERISAAAEQAGLLVKYLPIVQGCPGMRALPMDDRDLAKWPARQLMTVLLQRLH